MLVMTDVGKWCKPMTWTTLRAAELAGVLGFAERTLTVCDFDQVPTVMLDGLAGVIGCDTAKLTSFDLRTHREVAVFLPVSSPPTAQLLEYSAVAGSHPLHEPLTNLVGRRPPDLQPLRISDGLGARRWRATPLFAATQLTDIMCVVLGVRGSVIHAVTMGRCDARPFSDRQRDMLFACRGHLAAAVARARREPHHQALQIAPDVRWVAAREAPGVAARPGEPVRPQDRLSPRERQILALVAQGRTDAQVARSLDLSPTTVSKRLHLLYARLQPPNRVAAARYWSDFEAAQRTSSQPATLRR